MCWAIILITHYICAASWFRPSTTTLKEWDSTVEIIAANCQHVKDRCLYKKVVYC